MDKYEQLQSQYQSQGIQKDPNEVFYEAVGAHKKGKVYGLGEGVSLYYEKSTTSRSGQSTSSTASYAPSVIAQLEERCNNLRKV